MKKSLIIALLFVTGFCNAQQETFTKISELIKQTKLDVLTEDKLLVVNFDRSSAQQNKTLYTELEKTATVYEHAKLKGGKKGVVCVTIVNDTQAEVALDKEGYKRTVKIKLSDLGTPEKDIKNIAFNSNGEVIFKNINEKDIYGSVHKLITR